MTGLTNIFIDSFLSPIIPTFKGVFSADDINERLLNYKQFSIICNLSKRGEIGSHFVTLIIFPSHVLYLDSLSAPCIISSIAAFLTKLQKPVFFNTRQIQHSQSIYCGFYCIMFTMFFSFQFNFNLVFSKSLDQNDDKCVLYIKNMSSILNKSG